MQGKEPVGYNDRLFKSGFRRQFHLARFEWVARQMQRYNVTPRGVLELGCFDGKTLDFIPRPETYKGFDANWEGGLDIAREKRKHIPGAQFIQALTPAEMGLAPDERFDTAICMETLEHIPPALVEPYLQEIASHLDGYFFITVPNEKGPLFLAKWLAKFILNLSPEPYTFGEIVNATLGRTHKVKRREHKGFDYDDLIKQIGKHFDIIHVSGFPGAFLPKFLCFSVGIVARSRH